MVRYTIRIELHNATLAQYTDLYKHMAAEGFPDIIGAGDGTRYKMPPGEYNYEGKTTRDQVLVKAKSAAAKVVRSYAVFVTESAGRTWYGLKQV